MLTEIRALHLQLTEALRSHVLRRVDFALGQFGEHVRAVHARLLDLNGPHGGVDKLCVVTVETRGLRPIRAQAVHSNLYAAIDEATGIAGRRIARALERRRERRVDAGRSHKRRIK
ncbi:MAG: HPF/RaiA family ribosome-associated protein [Planctomycetes bacterium]|nr:HPF/RaiA family ribosome-associated protein [Planctomycetota bacterium]